MEITFYTRILSLVYLQERISVIVVRYLDSPHLSQLTFARV